MKRHITISVLRVLPVLLVPCTFLASGCDPEETVDAADILEPPARIVGGVETNYESWQSAVMVQLNNVLCSGTLIHPRVVLTAGHCVLLDDPIFGYRDFTDNPSRIAIWGGPTGMESIAGVREVAAHPDWTGLVDLESPDLALLLLDRDVSDLEPYRLRDFPSPEVEDAAVLVGYGDDAEGGAGVHRMGETAIQSIDARFIETGGDANTCGGDSGGPLLTQQDGDWVLTGVTSIGTEECNVSARGYAVNLLTYCSWLNDTMVALTGDDLGLERCTTCRAVPAETWGDPCGPGYPCCPEGTICRLPDEYSQNDLGYCAPACCSVETSDPMYCTDVTTGEERCSFIDDQGVAYCAIHCDDDGDCIPGTVCRNKPFESEKICIAREQGPGDILDCDASIGGTDGESDTAGETDGNGGGSDGCGCGVVSRTTDHKLYVAIQTYIQFVFGPDGKHQIAN